MGIDLPAFEFLLRAQSEFGDFGSTVVLGRQRLLIRNDADRDRFGSVLKQYRPDLEIDDILDENVDRLIAALGGTPYQVMDNSAYEGAEVIHDLNEPLPDALKGRFDTVIDIGTLEHVFNIATAMKSMAEAVRVGGQFLCLNIANHHLGHGFWQFSPEVFFRTFCPAHGYEPRMADLYYQGAFHPLADPQSLGQRQPIKTPGYTYITFAARKIEDRPVFESGWPIQADYLAAWKLFLARDTEAKGNPTEAETILRAALDAAADNPLYMVALAALLRRTDRQEDPEYTRLMTRAEELAPTLPALIAEQKVIAAAQAEEAGKRIDIGPVSLALEDPRVPEKTRDAMIRGRYEFKEREVARRMLSDGDRVIELGAGMGVVSLTIAKLVGSKAIRSFEANPVIIELARSNAEANDMPVTFCNVIASPRVIAEETPFIDFFVLGSFEASSTRRINPNQTAIQVPTSPLEDEISSHRANALVFDIEGFETEIISKTNLSGIDKLIMEIHPKILGLDTCVDLIDQLETKGLILRRDLAFGDVLAFERGIETAAMSGGALFAALNEMEAHTRAQEWEAALEIATQLQDLITENAYMQYHIAQIEKALGQDSPERVLRAAELGSMDFLLYTELAGRFIKHGDKPGAEKALTTLRQLFPRSPHLPTLTQRIKTMV